MAKLKRLNRSDRAKHNAKLGNVVREISKSSGIIATKSGNTFVINDSADAPISGLRIFGRTDQVKTTGANLFDVHSAEYIESKTYAEVSDDGTLKVASAVNGSYQNLYFSIYKLTVPETIFISFKARMGTDKTVPLIRIRYKNSESGAAATLYGVTDLTQQWKSCAYKLSITEARLAEYDTIEIIAYSNNSSTAISKDEAYVELKDIMISTSDVPYEPYTGLAPSPSPEYPQALNSVAEGGSVGVHIRGKQLFNPEWIQNHSAGGATVTNNGGGSLTVSGSGALTEEFTKYSTISDAEVRKFLKPGKLHVKFERITSPAFVIKILADGKTFYTFSNNEEANLMRSLDISSLFEGNKSISMRFYTGYGATGSTIKPGTIRPLLWQDGDETYDEYREPKTATFPTPNGLLGIPVESGGNYTDVNGQQWICDEIDSEKDEYIQRIGKVDNGLVKYSQNDSTNSLFVVIGKAMPDYLHQKNITTNVCSHCIGLKNQNSGRAGALARGAHVAAYAGADTAWYLVLPASVAGTTTSSLQEFFAKQEAKGTPFEWYYVLAEPIKKPLTEEIPAYKALRTHKPTTIVSNDAGAIVELSYYADKKNYIDQKFAELQALALENK